MLNIFNSIRGIETGAVIAKFLTAVCCSGLIGIERESKRRPAGLRSHILVCLGATIATTTGEFLVLGMHLNTDPGRLGAQVIAGIGFVGAGTIIVSRHNHIRGLTTAAGLWTTATIGLAIGLGYYECAIVVTLLVMLTETVFRSVEMLVRGKWKNMNLYLEYTGEGYLDMVFHIFKMRKIQVLDVDVKKIKENKKERKNIAIIYVQAPKNISIDMVLDTIKKDERTINVVML